MIKKTARWRFDAARNRRVRDTRALFSRGAFANGHFGVGIFVTSPSAVALFAKGGCSRAPIFISPKVLVCRAFMRSFGGAYSDESWHSLRASRGRVPPILSRASFTPVRNPRGRTRGRDFACRGVRSFGGGCVACPGSPAAACASAASHAAAARAWRNSKRRTFHGRRSLSGRLRVGFPGPLSRANRAAVFTAILGTRRRRPARIDPSGSGVTSSATWAKARCDFRDDGGRLFLSGRKRSTASS